MVDFRVRGRVDFVQNSRIQQLLEDLRRNTSSLNATMCCTLIGQVQPITTFVYLKNPVPAPDRHRLRNMSYQVPEAHAIAAVLPRAIGILISQQTYPRFISEVFSRMSFIEFPPNIGTARPREQARLYNDLANPLKAVEARSRILRWYYECLTLHQRAAIHKIIVDVVTDLIINVFGQEALDEVGGIDETLLKPGYLWNPVSMQVFISRLFKLDSNTDLCTELSVERLREIAKAFNKYCGARDIDTYVTITDCDADNDEGVEFETTDLSDDADSDLELESMEF